MIQYIVGNLMESEAEALVNTVNTVGVMGKGIALQFKNNFPKNYKKYQKACRDGSLHIGHLLVEEDNSMLYGKKIIINFPTKTDWRKPSEYEYISLGLVVLVKLIADKKIKSIAIPPLGAGNGGLNWGKVKELIETYLGKMDCVVFVYEPDYQVQETLKKERVALTPARAMLLSVLYDLVRNGEFVSEFAAEKICYFLQRFGAEKIFKLNFKPNFYGPYSGRVKHVLFYLNGSYLRGFSTKDKKPFEELDLLMDTEEDVLEYLSTKPHEKEITEKTKTFLSGYYGNFELELLSTLDFIAQEEQTHDLEIIKQRLSNWSERKTQLFNNVAFIEKGLKKLETIPAIQITL